MMQIRARKGYVQANGEDKMEPQALPNSKLHSSV
jgi:hypothetical protein